MCGSDCNVTELLKAPEWAVEMLRRATLPARTALEEDGPPVRLSEWGMRLWRGDVVLDTEGRVGACGEAEAVDRSATLFAIGLSLARAGASGKTIVEALRERDAALYGKYGERRDGGETEYLRIAEKVLASVEGAVPNRDGGDRAAPSGPKLVSAAELAKRAFPELRWVVPGVIPEGMTLLAGKPKQGKSFLALGVGLAVATGGRALGRIAVEKGAVLYLALEDGERRLQRRMADMLGEIMAPAGLEFATEYPTIDKGGLELMDEWLRDHPRARLVVVDTLKRIRPRERAGASQYGQDYEAIAPLADLARKHGVGVVVVHHVRKMKADDPMDTVSGTLGLSGAADAILVLDRVRGGAEGKLSVMGRDVTEADLALRWSYPHWALVGEVPEAQQSPERRAIVRLVREKGALTPKAVAEGLGKNHSTTKNLMRKMFEAGELESVEGGRYIVARKPTEAIDPLVSVDWGELVDVADPTDAIVSVDPLDLVDLVGGEESGVEEVGTTETTWSMESMGYIGGRSEQRRDSGKKGWKPIVLTEAVLWGRARGKRPSGAVRGDGSISSTVGRAEGGEMVRRRADAG